MAKKLSTQAQLQLSVTDALNKIKQLSAELKQVKEDIKQPMKLDVQLDTSKMQKQMSDLKKVLGGNRNAKGQFTTIASDVRGIRSELNKLNTTLGDVIGKLNGAEKQANQFSNSMQKSFNGSTQRALGLVNNLQQINFNMRKTGEEATKVEHKIAGAFAAAASGVSSFVSGVDKAYTAFRSLGTGFLSTIGSIANTALETVGFSVNGMVDEAMEQERKLQQSKIGFTNMFKGQNPDTMISQVRQTAAASPELNSGDLADYINQLGAVSGGSFDTAFNATMGILKTVQYGGGDANSQMGYIIKNVRDVMAKGKATQVDVQQFNRAMPMLQKSLEAIGASDFLKDGQLTITKDNANKLMEAFAKLNTPDNPAYGIFDQTGKTLAGIQEEFREATASSIAEGLEDIGFFDALAEVSKKSLLPEVQNDIREFFKWLGEVNKDIDWNLLKKEVGGVVKEVKTLVGELAVFLKDNFLNTDGLKLIVELVGEFIKGMLSGAKNLLGMINGIRQYLGDDGLKNLASSLGRAVTQGWLLSKVISVVAGGFETLAHVAQASSLFKNNVGGGALGTASNALGFLSGSTANGSFASNVGQKVAAATGLRYTTITKGVAGAGKVARFVGKAGAGALKGGAITMLTSAVSGLVKDFNLLGGASEGVANTLKVVGAAIGGAIMGKILGPLGMLGGALIGAITAIKSIQHEAEVKKAEESRAKVKEIKAEGGEKVLQAAIDTFRSNGYTFDEGTDAAVWTKNQVIDYLNNTPADKWDAEKIYDRFVSAYRQKLGHEIMVKGDNQNGFWDLKGEAVDYLTKNEKGENDITEYGKRLAKLIRDYNMVGYDSMDELNNTSDETLVREYLANDQAKLNAAQIEFLENEAKQFEQQTGNAMTATKDKITNAIKDFGTLDTAIENAKKAGDEAFAKTLEAYKALKDAAQKVKDEINGETEGDKFWSEDTAKEYLGEEGAKKYEEWKNTKEGWFNDYAGALGYVYGTKRPEEIIKNLADEKYQLEKNAETSTGQEHERDLAAIKLIDDYLEEIKNVDAGDWESMSGYLLNLATGLKMQDRGAPVLNLENITLGDETELEALMRIIREWGHGKLKSPYAMANGGAIKPIFRANGGMSGKGVDVVPAYLQPGEFVQRKTAVETAGLSVMQALNNGDLAQAYKLIGSKISGSWNNSRNDYSNRDNRHYQNNNFFIRNFGRSGRAGTQNTLANHIALGY